MHARSLVYHDFTEYGAKESTKPVGDAPRLDVDVSGDEWFSTLYVKSGFEQSVVEATDEATHGRLLERIFTGRVVSVDGQLVEVVHVVAVVDTLVCVTTIILILRDSTVKVLLLRSFYNLLH